MKKLVLIAIPLLFLNACATVEKTAEKVMKAPEVAPSEQSNLSRLDAELRAAQVSDVHYALTVKLDESADYSGEQTIRFQMRKILGDLRVDFFKGEIKNVTVNGNAVEIQKTPTFFTLPKQALRLGENEVKIAFATTMQTNGTGLHRFVDPEDKNVFLYTQFETYYANKFMPCFDQPDLKATMQMQVSAPKEWTVVTTTRETKTTVEGRNKIWNFAKTVPLSTYLFSLHAGPYKVWNDTYDGMPIRLMVRPKLAPYVDTKLWFTVTKQGLGFFNQYFDYSYPFFKYDQLIVPEFNAGAMENVGAVTFSERFVRRGKATRDEQLNFSEVILHEMAHMWFGDLVTMKWWNDLWLNESFASYMATLALTSSTKFTEGWKDFHSGMKLWAYWQDQLPTTHPIESDVKDTEEAFSSFDGITYGKGASVLKQMNRWLTPDVFQKGVRHYMKTFAYKNAELKDFIASLQKFSDRDFTGWSAVWLQQAGVDTARVRFQCDKDKLKSIKVDVTPQIPGRFRPQALEFAFYKKNNGKLELAQKESLEITLPKQEISVSGACPDLVHANYNDHGYIKLVFDEKSLAALKAGLSDVKDPLERIMYWANLWQMVRDQEMSLVEYAEVAARHLPKENDLSTLKLIVSYISGNRRGDDDTVLAYWPKEPPVLNQKREEFVAKMESIYSDKLKAAPPGSDNQTFWWDNFVRLSQTPTALAMIADGLKDKSKLPRGFELDQDRRWNALKRLCRSGHADCMNLVSLEKGRDSSDRGKKEALSCEALRPDFAAKQKLMTEVLATNSLSLEQKSAISRSLFPYEQREMASRLEDKYYQYMRDNKKADDFEFLEQITDHLAPLSCTQQQSEKMQKFLSQNSDLPTPVSRGIKEMLDDDFRCQKIRAKLIDPSDGKKHAASFLPFTIVK